MIIPPAGNPSPRPYPRLQEALEVPPEQAADQYRSAARTLLREQSPAMTFPISSEVEMTALTLFEKSLLQGPAALAVVPGAKALGPHALYSATLAALMGCPGSVSAGVAAVLDQFHCWQDRQGSSPLKTLGEFEDQVVATHAVGPNTPLACGEFSVNLCGHLQPNEVSNIHNALQEIVKKTDTKALHLVKEIYVRPFLAEYHSPDGSLAAIDGIANGRLKVGLLHSSARDPQACRLALFHELGHELEHILSGRYGPPCSERPDTPFGKTQDPADYVSPYARTAPGEDFAETHAALIMEWDKIMASPQSYLQSRGEIGNKMAWILEHGYRIQV